MKITKNLSGLSKNEIRSTYFSNMKPILNDRAMFADATEEYRSPEEPSAGDTVKLKFRTAKYNVDRVEVVVNGIAYSMKKFMTNTNFDYYIAEFTLGAQRTEYYFHALVGRTSIYYNQDHTGSSIQPIILLSIRALRHRIGRRALLYTRYMSTVSTTETRAMTWLIMSMCI